jgi:Secretion system C-terminal sorting domain
MIKNFKQTSLALSAALFMAAGANAQVIWGAGSGVPANQTVGEFTSTNGTIVGAGWTEIMTTHRWNYTTNGQSLGTLALASVNQGTGVWLTSPTIATGAAIFDSDNYYTLNNTDVPQSGIIESPSIDLSAQIGNPLSVRFYTSYLNYRTDSTHLEFSADGGATWNYVDIRPTTGGSGNDANFNGWVNVNITPFMTGALTNCKLRFHFKGDSYFWAVDDVSIQTAPAYDIALAVPGVGTTLGDAFTTAQVSNYYYQPLSQVSGREYYFAARVTNGGTTDILPTANPQLHIKIDRSTGPNMWANEYMDSIALDTVFAGANIDASDSIAWLPTAAGAYRATYFVRHTGSDASTSNDTTVRMFNISNNNYFSKVPRSATDFFPSATGASFPTAAVGNKISEFEYGSMFFFPTGTNYQLDSVTFRAYIQSIGAGFTGGVITTRIAEFTDVDGNGRLDNANPNPELTLVGLGSTTLGLPSGTSGYVTGVSPIVDVNSSAVLSLMNNKVYLVSLAQSRPTGLEDGTSFFGYWYGSYDINYALNAGTDPLIAPSPVRVGEITSTGAAGSNDWNWIGFGADQVPSIALNISLVSSVIEKTNGDAKMNIYPNPTNDILNVQVDLKGISNVQYIMTDISGRVVRMQTNKNVMSEITTFNVANLPAGVYFMSIKTENSVTTQRFVKQ